MTTGDLTSTLMLEISKRYPGSVIQRINVMAGNVGARFVRSALPGTSDLVGMLAPSGKFLAIELKQKGDSLSVQQFAFLQAVKRGGGIALVCGRTGLRSLPEGITCVAGVDEAMEWIEEQL